MVRSAPIARSTSSAPARVGLRPTFSTTTSLPGTTSAATIRNVADDRSPGMVSAVALRRPFQPVGSTTISPLGGGGDRRAEESQHPFGVIARAGRLAQHRSPARLQRRQDERALELGAGDLQLVLDADERAAADAQRRVDVARARRIAPPFDRRPHLAQRRRHPPHRPPRERGVAPHLGLERPPGQEAQQEADRRPRVAAVERLGRFVQPGEPDAGDARLTGLELDVDAERPQRRRRRQVVAPVPEAARLDDTVAERAEQQRAVGDRLVTGDPAAAAQRARAADMQRG